MGAYIYDNDVGDRATLAMVRLRRSGRKPDPWDGLKNLLIG